MVVLTIGEMLLAPVPSAVVADLALPRLVASYHALLQLAWGRSRGD